MGRIITILSVVVGNFIYALSVKLFLLPAGLITGGTNGIALVLEHYWDIPITAFVLVFNVVMLCVGWLVLGRAFAMTTVASSFLYPVFLEIFDRVLGGLVLTDDILLCTFFFGLGVGVGLGLVLRAGASTGGMDIPPLILKKKFRIPIPVGMYCFDSFIILAQVFFRPIENVLYGIILIFVYTIVLDKMLMLGKSKTELKIVSPKHKEICAAILTEVDRGVTLMTAEGGYSGCQTQLVFSVVSNREIIKVEKLVHEIDPECFMVVTRVSEVRGKGFSIKR